MNCSIVKHITHCVTYTGLVVLLQMMNFARYQEPEVDPIAEYGYVLTITLYLCQMIPLLALPYILENALGLFVFNAFADTVELKYAPQMAPFICFRVVTRGDFPALVRRNVDRNRNLCIEAGLKHFCVEVVTDKSVDVPKSLYTKEVVVPTSYKTSSGALYKGRALQYCLEAANNNLRDDDWIVHLDEETLLTRRAIFGILNFICKGDSQFGQGVISYANEGVVNWLTTLIDSFRVSEDLGRLRWDLTVWRCPLTGWKGSFMVALAGAERKVTFDHGFESSMLEDNFFSMNAIAQGYSFNFIEGEMWEKSPFTIWDFFQQRKRWFLGGVTLLHSHTIPFKLRLLGLIGLYFLLLSPFGPLFVMARSTFPLPGLWPVDSVLLFVYTTSVYMHIFGVFKSYNVNRIGLPKFLLNLAGLLIAFPFIITLQVVVVVVAMCDKKRNFYVVKKDAELIVNNTSKETLYRQV